MAELAQLAELVELLAQLAQLAELVMPGRTRCRPTGREAAASAGPLGLLVLQPTPFCNLACDYCYLPDRDNRARMSMATLDTAMRRVFESGLTGPDLSIVWHAGEPLAVPPEYYEQAFAVIERRRPLDTRLHYHVQTNATLVTDRWCELIARHDLHVGVSVDGPAWLHDRHRRTRRGRGTHAAAMAGLGRLRARGIAFHAICVLTRESLDVPDEIVEFLHEARIDEVGFNVEEIEAGHRASSLDARDVESAVARFWNRLIDRVQAGGFRLRVREIDEVILALQHPNFGAGCGNAQNAPFQIVSVAHQGDFTTYSPELLGVTHTAYGSLAFGNVGSVGLLEVLEDPRFRRVSADVAAGVSQCRRTCKYFAFCLGGAPANKLAERGTFACTETMFCRLTQKIVVECVLRAIEEDRLTVPQEMAAAARR